MQIANMKGYYYALLVSFLLSACVAIPKNNVIALTDNVTYSLTAPPKAMVNKTVSHLVEVSYLNDQHRFIAQVEYRKSEIALAAISVEGLPLFDFTWQQGSVVEVNQYLPMQNVDINYIIADMQLCHWTFSQLKKSVKGQQARVIQTMIGNKGMWRRSIYDHETLIVEVTKTKTGFQVNNKIRNYLINLTHLSKESL